MAFTHFEILVEEPSAEAALEHLLPKILVEKATFRIHPFEGKRDLMGKLEARLKGYAKSRPADTCIVVMVDRDDEDCVKLKGKLEAAARTAGLATRSKPQGNGQFRVLNRILVEELEAWFFGDVEALVLAYPGVSTTLAKKARYRDPDAITGGTWEALERVLKAAGHHSGGLAKIQAAREIAAHMDPFRNRSKSFQVFRDAIIACVSR
jgi:hypothetical protein